MPCEAGSIVKGFVEILHCLGNIDSGLYHKKINVTNPYFQIRASFERYSVIHSRNLNFKPNQES